MQEVAELAIKNGGIVFGGFVRDFILHEDAANKFFSEYDVSEYNNQKIAPHLSDRFLVPSDIDVKFQNREQYICFKNELTQKMSYRITVGRGTYTMDMVSLFLSLELKLQDQPFSFATTLLRNQFKDCVKIVPGGQFKVDVIFSNEHTLDFECNGLVMDLDGIRIGSELGREISPFGKFRKLEQVKSDILNKRAVCVSFIQKRWEKMDLKDDDWEICGCLVHKIKKSECGEECIICHEPNTRYKLSCCNARYHKECLKKTFVHDETRCAHCRYDFDIFTQHEVKSFAYE